AECVEHADLELFERLSAQRIEFGAGDETRKIPHFGLAGFGGVVYGGVVFHRDHGQSPFVRMHSSVTFTTSASASSKASRIHVRQTWALFPPLEALMASRANSVM